jgi:NADH-quinone oxidoreductase subunit M
MIRFAAMILPQAHVTWSTTLSVFAVISIIYGAMNALAAKDLKKMIAYSSVSHMGFVILGIAAGTAVSVQGAIFQMVSHGVISAMLFIIAGILQDRTGDRTISNYSGLFSGMPWYASLMLIAFFAGMGIPGFSSFIGEVLVLLGSFGSTIIPGWLTLTATAGILLSAGYFAWTAQRMLFGDFHSKAEGTLTDLKFMEKGLLVLLAFLTFYLGIMPGSLLNIIGDFSGDFEALIRAATMLK